MVVLRTRSQAKNFAKRMKKHYKKLDVPWEYHVTECNSVFIDYDKRRVMHTHKIYVEGCPGALTTAKILGVLKYKL